MQPNKYIIKVDDENHIIYSAYTFNYTEDDFEITREEYEKVPMYQKFNPETRVFSEEISKDVDEPTDRERIERVEEMVGMLAEQLAKQSLGM